ncbi:DUF58 domain-containing protein [Candidatus Sumerlaeota bacterium]
MTNPNLEFRLLSKRNILLLVTALALSAGWTLRSPGLIFLGELLLALLAAAWFVSRRLLETFEVTRHHHPHAFEGAKVTVEMVCRHNSPLPLYLLELIDEFPPGDLFYIRSAIAGPFPRGSELRVQYEGHCTHRRGLYRLGPLRVSTADPLGIFEQQRTLPQLSFLYLLPDSAAVDRLELLERGTLRHVGRQTLPQVGRAESFIHLREYRRGDNVRQIHALSSARREELIVKELEDNVTTDVNLILDLRRIARRGVGDSTTTEHIIKSAACVAQSAIAKSHRVQIFTIGEKIEHIPLGEGQAQLYHILDRMAVWQAKGNPDFGLETAQRLCQVRPGSTLVWHVCASVFDPAWVEPFVPGLLMDDVKVIIVFVDDRTFYKLSAEHDRLHYQGHQLEDLVARFKNLGCTVYVIGREDNIVTQLSLPR